MKTIRIEICSYTSNVLLLCIAGLTLVACTWILSRDYTERTCAALAAGYEEATLPGRMDFAWVKAEKKP